MLLFRTRSLFLLVESLSPHQEGIPLLNIDYFHLEMNILIRRPNHYLILLEHLSQFFLKIFTYNVQLNSYLSYLIFSFS